MVWVLSVPKDLCAFFLEQYNWEVGRSFKMGEPRRESFWAIWGVPSKEIVRSQVFLSVFASWPQVSSFVALCILS